MPCFRPGTDNFPAPTQRQRSVRFCRAPAPGSACRILPVAAIDKLRIELAIAAVYSILINGVTYLVYASAKRKAQQDAASVSLPGQELDRLKPPSSRRLRISPALFTGSVVADHQVRTLNLDGLKPSRRSEVKNLAARAARSARRLSRSAECTRGRPAAR